MSNGFTLKRRFSIWNKQRGRKTIQSGNTVTASSNAIPRVARLMALAIRFDQLIQDGTVTDQAELARLGRVSRARLTQIMNLLNLAPDLQEALLYLQSPGQGRAAISERTLRPIAATPNWQKQRLTWTTI